ncbi:uncharacterized protein PAC_04680 [Phialocephala subalpina]|uniref:Uncharacterized protein n=1 Tax=Phialocephala subalpina TaxID=576137 RepID=A0A1L7WPU9_9HELO|nr:uncharacterized protein PAC_04680 [Phialocephala subalpina]
MDGGRTDIIEAVLRSGWGDFAAARARERGTTTTNYWRGDATQNQAAGSRENELPITPQPAKIDVQAAQKHVNQINAHIAIRPATRPHPSSVVKSEPEPDSVDMQSSTIYQPPATQTAHSAESNQERVIPVYRPHHGTRSQFEKRYGLAPGGSYTAGRKSSAQTQQAEVKQEEIKQEVKQEGDALRGISNGHLQYGTRYQAASYASPAPPPTNGESAWSKVDNLSHPAQQHEVSSPLVKQEELTPGASPEVTANLDYQSRAQATATFSPTTRNGLAASRYASNPAAGPRPLATRLSRQETAPPRLVIQNTQHVYRGQTLVDPMAFMSAVNGAAGDKQQTPQPPTPPPVAQPQPSPQPAAVKKTSYRQPTPPQPTLPKKEKDTEYSDEAYTNFVGTKAFGNRYQSPQSPSGWPVFPSSTPAKPQTAHIGSVARWGDDPTVSIAMASPNDPPAPAPASAAQYHPENHVQSTSAWQKFATTEGKKSKQPLQAVQFVPATSRWSDDDPGTPSPTKAPAPKLVVASKYQGYETAIPNQGSPAPPVKRGHQGNPLVERPVETAINNKPLSELVNADRIKIKALEAELEEQGSRLETIEQELEAYKEERIEMDRELEAYRAESDYTKELRQRYRTLQAEYDALKATKAAPPAPAAAPADNARLEWLETRNRELQLEVHLKEPLFQIGKDVRTRYLEEARSSQLKVAQLDKAAIKRGHVAVWNALGEADAAVLNGGFLTNLQLKNLTPVFKTLYGDDPKEYYKLSAKMRDAMDAYATLQTSAALNSNHPNRPLQEINIVEATVRLMSQKHNTMGTKAFEEDAGGHAARALQKIKDAMVPCLKFDRKWDRTAIKEKLARDGNGSSTQSTEKGGAPVKH